MKDHEFEIAGELTRVYNESKAQLRQWETHHHHQGSWIHIGMARFTWTMARDQIGWDR